jgi:hypothetical protein
MSLRQPYLGLDKQISHTSPKTRMLNLWTVLLVITIGQRPIAHLESSRSTLCRVGSKHSRSSLPLEGAFWFDHGVVRSS